MLSRPFIEKAPFPGCRPDRGRTTKGRLRLAAGLPLVNDKPHGQKKFPPLAVARPPSTPPLPPPMTAVDRSPAGLEGVSGRLARLDSRPVRKPNDYHQGDR